MSICKRKKAVASWGGREMTCILAVLPLLVITWFGCNRTAERGQIISKIKKVAHLATVQFTIKKHLYARKEKRIFFIKLNNAVVLAETKAYITAGIDLEKIQPEDITIRNDSICIDLPAVRILDFSYPFRDVGVNRQYTRGAFLNPLKLSDLDKMLQSAELEIRAYVNHLGIREAAQKKTINLLTRFLHYIGYKEVNIRFPQEVKNEPLFNISDVDIIASTDDFAVNQPGGGK